MAQGELRSSVHLFLVPPTSGVASPDDQSLVAGFLAGDPFAAQSIWAKHASLVDRALRRLLGPDHEVEDLAQEVFLRVFAKMHTLQDPSALRSFIYSVAIRVTRWELRRRWVRRCLSLSASGVLPEPLATSEDFEARQAVVRFYAILDQLTGLDRAAFMLYHFEGLSLEEAAQSLGVSLSTVKRRIHRATKRINQSVQGDPALMGYLRPAKTEERTHV